MNAIKTVFEGQRYKSNENYFKVLKVNEKTGKVRLCNEQTGAAVEAYKDFILQTMELVKPSIYYPTTYFKGLTKSRDLKTAIRDMKRDEAERTRNMIARAKKEISDAGKKHKERIAKYVESYTRCYEVYDKLVIAGFQPSMNIDTWNPNVQLKIDKKQLPFIRRILGVPLKATGNNTLTKESKRKILVALEAEGYPELTIRYLDKLPKPEESNGEKPKCRVEVIKHKAYTERRLVCDAN